MKSNGVSRNEGLKRKKNSEWLMRDRSGTGHKDK